MDELLSGTAVCGTSRLTPFEGLEEANNIKTVIIIFVISIFQQFWRFMLSQSGEGSLLVDGSYQTSPSLLES